MLSLQTKSQLKCKHNSVPDEKEVIDYSHKQIRLFAALIQIHVPVARSWSTSVKLTRSNMQKQEVIRTFHDFKTQPQMLRAHLKNADFGLIL